MEILLECSLDQMTGKIVKKDLMNFLLVANKSLSALIRKSIIYRIFPIELTFLLPESVQHLTVGIELLD